MLNPPTYLVAIDPSLRNAGVAAFLTAGGQPVSVQQVTHPGGDPDEYRARAVDMAEGIAISACTAIGSVGMASDMCFVIETPNNWFTQRGQASKDNDAIQRLYFFVGVLAMRMAAIPGCKFVWGVEPISWKGTTPKDIMVQRAHKYAPLDKDTPHDAVEALMMGKFALGHLRTTGFTAPLRCIRPYGFGGYPRAACTYKECLT